VEKTVENFASSFKSGFKNTSRFDWMIRGLCKTLKSFSEKKYFGQFILKNFNKFMSETRILETNFGGKFPK